MVGATPQRNKAAPCWIGKTSSIQNVLRWNTDTSYRMQPLERRWGTRHDTGCYHLALERWCRWYQWSRAEQRGRIEQCSLHRTRQDKTVEEGGGQGQGQDKEQSRGEREGRGAESSIFSTSTHSSSISS